MRKVLKSTNEVFHYWANKVQSEGKAAAVFFDGDYLYSYGKHFCIARHLPNNTAAFTTRSYSVTTSGHVSSARSAARHLNVVFCNDPTDSAMSNMRFARNAIRDALSNSEKKGIRQTTRDKFKAQALHLADSANAYLAALPADESEGQEPINTQDLEAVRTHLVAVEQATKRLQEEQLQARMADLQDSLEKWRSGEVLARTGLYSIPPALRLAYRDDNRFGSSGWVVETSHGAEIPVADAHKLWPIILRVMAGSKDYTPGEPIGAYSLTQIRTDGSIRVGCHDIAFAEIKGIAAKLGLLDEVVA